MSDGEIIKKQKTSRFLTDQIETGDLRNQSVRGASIASASRIVALVMRIGSTGVLARLLSPNDYGLIAMTTLTIGFFSVFSDAGLSSATIQKKTITHSQISTLFWINLAIGALLATIVSSSAPLVAWFYGEDELVDITIALSLSFMIGAFAVQHQALLRRQLRFGLLAIAELTSSAGGITIAIYMAYNNYGYWSLVGLNLGAAALKTILVLLLVRWIPGLPKLSSGVLSMLKFGGDVLFFNAVNFFTRNADNLLIGRYWGASALGLYEKAYSLLLLPIGQINGPLGAVGISALSRLQHDPARFQEYFITVIRIIASLTIPIILILSIFSEQIVAFWLGEGWAESATLFKLLTFGAIIGSISNPLGWLLVSLGETKKYRTMGLVNSTLVMTAFIIGLPYGPSGVALGYSGAAIILFLPIWWYAISDTPVCFINSLRALSPSTISGVLVGLPTYLFVNKNPLELTSLPLFTIGALAFGSAYAIVLLIVFKEMPLLKTMLKELLPTQARQA